MARCDSPQEVSPNPKQVQDGRVDGEEALGLPGRFEAAHEPFPESRRLGGGLGAIVLVLGGAVSHRGHGPAVGGSVAAQLVGNEPDRHPAVPLQLSPKEPCGRLAIPARLHEDIEDVTVLVHCAPEILAPALNGDEQLVEMPCVAQRASATSQAAGIVGPEGLAPLADLFVGDCNAPLDEQILHIVETEPEAAAEPHRVADDLRREAVATIAWRGARHKRRLPPTGSSLQSSQGC